MVVSTAAKEKRKNVLFFFFLAIFSGRLYGSASELGVKGVGGSKHIEDIPRV